MILLSFVLLHSASLVPGMEEEPFSDNPSGKRYVMVVFFKDSDYFNWAAAGMREAAKELGEDVRVEYLGCEFFDATLEAKILLEVVESSPDGILLSASDPEVLKGPINKAVRAGIPVICFDSDAPGSDRLAYVGTNNYKAGLTAGREMAKWLDGEGEVCVVTLGNMVHLAERVRGFRDAINEAASGTRIFVVSESGKARNTEVRVQATLTANSRIRYIYCSYGSPTVAVSNAVRNLKPSRKVEILASDFDKPTISEIESGMVRAAVAQDPYKMGYESLLLLHRAVHPKRSPSTGQEQRGAFPSVIDTGSWILRKEDLGEYLKALRWSEEVEI